MSRPNRAPDPRLAARSEYRASAERERAGQASLLPHVCVETPAQRHAQEQRRRFEEIVEPLRAAPDLPDIPLDPPTEQGAVVQLDDYREQSQPQPPLAA